jgi:hypothetical protein
MMPCRIFISRIWQIAKAICKLHKFVSHINLFKLRFTRYKDKVFFEINEKNYLNRIAFTGEIRATKSDGMSKTSKVIKSVPRLSQRIVVKLSATGATAT